MNTAGGNMNPPPYTAPVMRMGQHQHSHTLPPLAPPQQFHGPGPVASARPRPAGVSVREDRAQSAEYNGYIWTLKVVQQPQRARMCGFGDKDRRPITPPPALLLIVSDPKTGRELSPNELEDINCAHLVVNVDLWDEGKVNEAILVRANSNTPSSSISSASATAYPPTEQSLAPRGTPLMMMNDGYQMHGYPMPGGYAGGYAVAMPSPYGHYAAAAPGAGFYPTAHMAGAAIPYYAAHSAQNSNFTRNLIGSLSVNAARLNNEHGEPGFYFVFQDLSVRMEGNFRLRMNFVNLSDGASPPGLNRGKCPIICWVFTEPFKVYSAKKFPGVIESTPLSKCFAGQGIKIPIRKDNGGKTGADDEDDGE